MNGGDVCIDVRVCHFLQLFIMKLSKFLALTDEHLARE